VAARFNANPVMPERVTWKAVQDRYKKLQEWFDKVDDFNSKLSGAGEGGGSWGR